jgi:hypothetical protein
LRANEESAAIPSGITSPARDCFTPPGGVRNDTIIIEEVFKLLTNLDGKFNLKLADGVWKLKACRPGFMFPSLLVNGSYDGKFTNIYHDEYLEVKNNGWQLVLPEARIVNKIEPYLSMPLDPQPKAGKYQKAIFCAKLIGVFLGLWAILLFILIPSCLSLAVFILFGIIAIRTLEIH